MTDVEPSAAMNSYRVRAGTLNDVPFLRRIVYEASHFRVPGERTPESVEAALRNPDLANYVHGWGRPGDAAMIAETAEGAAVGAAWYRLFAADRPGYGFIGPTVPELGIAVLPDYRGRGIGGALIDALLQQARASGFAAVSLSVRADNPAARLYLRHGFVHVRTVPAANGGSAWTMRADLQ
jgi:ribosomal protein S18 acetylase RimI-like enzyme